MQIKVSHIEKTFSITDFENESWAKTEDALIDKYWSGENAPNGRHFKTKVLWSDSALYVQFEANQTEPPIVSDMPDLKTKTIGLWDRDVCEIFVAPDIHEPERYFEFEIAPTGAFVYPDVTVVCGEPAFREGARPDTLTNPTLIVEVLSESTEAFDRGEKFAHYQRLESLQEYVLVSQNGPRIERFTRQPDDQWLLGTAAGLEASVHLASVGCDLALFEVYDRITFAPSPAG